MRYVGIDIGKADAHVSIRSELGEVLERCVVRNDEDGFRKLAERLQPGDRLGLEASTYAYALHDHFLAKGYEVWMGDPKRLRAVWDTDHKNDVQDADELSDLLRIGRFPRAYVPPPDVLRLRSVVRAHVELGVEGTRVKNRIHALLDGNGIKVPFRGKQLFEKKGLAWLKEPRWNDERDTILRTLVMQLESIDERRDVLDDEMVKKATDDPLVRRLMTTTGIDYYLALVIVAEVGDASRFTSVSRFRSYAGCAPRWGQSGKMRWSNGTARMCNERLKWAFSMATQGAVNGENPVAEYYEKQLRKTKQVGKSLSRARVKLCDTVYALLKGLDPCAWGNPATVQIKQRRLTRRAAQGAGA